MTGGRPLRGGGDHVDLDEHALDAETLARDNGRGGQLVRGEELVAYAAHPPLIVGVGQVDGHVHDVGEGGARRLQVARDVLEDQPGLALYVADVLDVQLGVDRGGAGHEVERVRVRDLDDVAVAARQRVESGRRVGELGTHGSRS